MRWKYFQNPFDGARLFDDANEVLAGNFFAVAKAQNRAFGALLHQIIIQRGLIFEVYFGFSARDFIERRLGDVEVAAFDQFAHMAEEKRQQ